MCREQEVFCLHRHAYNRQRLPARSYFRQFGQDWWFWKRDWREVEG
jgi:hypothetical protein